MLGRCDEPDLQAPVLMKSTVCQDKGDSELYLKSSKLSPTFCPKSCCRVYDSLKSLIFFQIAEAVCSDFVVCKTSSLGLVAFSPAEERIVADPWWPEAR